MKSFDATPDDALAAEIKARVKGKVAIVGIGNIIRGDDGLGPKFIELARNNKINARLFDCGTAPENYILPILSTSSETIIFIDAADFGAKSGDIRVLNIDQISDVSFSTHSPSPRLFIDLLKTGKEDLNIFFISIQPKTTALGESLSDEVMSSLEFLKSVLAEALS